MRDPLAEPQPGDVVQGVWIQPQIHVGDPPKITVQGRLDNLVCFTSSADCGGRHLNWILLSDWCDVDPWFMEWKNVMT